MKLKYRDGEQFMPENRKLEYGPQDEEEMTVTLTLEDDSELECTVVAIFPVQEKDYIALLPFGAEEVFLYRFKHGSEDWQLENIEDDEEFEAVADAYDALVGEEQ